MPPRGRQPAKRKLPSDPQSQPPPISHTTRDDVGTCHTEVKPTPPPVDESHTFESLLSSLTLAIGSNDGTALTGLPIKQLLEIVASYAARFATRRTVIRDSAYWTFACAASDTEYIIACTFSEFCTISVITGTCSFSSHRTSPRRYRYVRVTSVSRAALTLL